VFGQDDVIDLVLAALFSSGHVLLEGPPGTAKTLLARTVAAALRLDYRRVQMTPDLLPIDITGSSIFREDQRTFEFRKGPIFTNFLLADEINRATPKTQSALLEAMNEKQVTIDGRSHTLPEPFMVIATQNPVEHHGTYPLPESQLDRFLMRVRIGYPDLAAEREILRRTEQVAKEAEAVLGGEELASLQASVGHVTVDDAIVDYMLAIVDKTRNHESLSLGVSPRGAQAIYKATQAFALVDGRDYATPDDVKRLVLPVFAHRVSLNARVALTQRSTEAAERVLQEILTQVDVPL
jgi:MoxR-like ATPase